MKNWFLLLFLSALPLMVTPCTTFVLKNADQLIFGRNLDWISDKGVVVINKRNVSKTALVMPPEQPVSWTSKYGSITFNQFGKEFPFGGINERGLVVEVMVVAGSYPAVDERETLNELQWVQYQLDNARTVDDVINSDKFLRISKVSQNLHFLVCDSAGNVAVIDFTRGGMLVYRNKDLPFPVLANDPYSTALVKHKSGVEDRFQTAAAMLDQNESADLNATIDYSFDILKKVALDGSWSIVYDIKHMQIHFKTASNKHIRKICIREFDFDCGEESLVYNLGNRDRQVVNELFSLFDLKSNNKVFDQALKSNKVRLPEVALEAFYNYNSTCKCSSQETQ